MCACAGTNGVITVFIPLFGSDAVLVNAEDEKRGGERERERERERETKRKEQQEGGWQIL